MNKIKQRGKARRRSELVEAVRGLHKIGAIHLNAEESVRMAEAILNPREPNARLLAAAKSHRIAQRMEDLDDEDLEAIAKAEVPAQFAHLDKLDLGES